MKIILLFLTCANEKEADVIARTLLEKRLIVCAKKLPISSSFFWKGSIDSVKEVLLIMESVEEKFNQIEREVRKLHSYETFVLLSVPVSRASKGVVEWVRGGLERK
ncbi:divalent-cation tolerance protein CutA [Patescibacteria group bacterium]|nr:divalent-cation tolerance protein CutA [Patescibacteria group bacterium]